MKLIGEAIASERPRTGESEMLGYRKDLRLLWCVHLTPCFSVAQMLASQGLRGAIAELSSADTHSDARMEQLYHSPWYPSSFPSSHPPPLLDLPPFSSFLTRRSFPISTTYKCDTRSSGWRSAGTLQRTAHHRHSSLHLFRQAQHFAEPAAARTETTEHWVSS